MPTLTGKMSLFFYIRREVLRLRESNFTRQVSILATGSLIAQVIVISFSPIITRIFSPEAMGVAAFFIAVVGPLAIISTMSYPIAIVLPKNKNRAFRLIVLSLSLAIIFTTVFSLLWMMFNQKILLLIDMTEVSQYMYLVPVAIVGSALSGVTSQWLVRNELFLLTAKIAVITAIVTGAIKVVVGYFYPDPVVLVYVSLLGLFLSTFFLIYYRPQDFFELINGKIFIGYVAKMYITAREYKDFLFYRTPQSLLNTLNNSIPIILLSTFFGMSNSGHYSLTFAVLSVPITIISGSVYQVIYPKISRLESNNAAIDIAPLLVKSTAWLAIVGIVPMIIVMAAGQEIFTFVFGESWDLSGIYAQWMSISLFFYYIARPMKINLKSK